MRKLRVEIPGRPVPQERPFFGGKGRIFDRPKSKARKVEVKLLTIAAMQKQNWGEPRLSEKPITLILGFYGAHGGADIDNLQKNVLDGLNGVVYKDDRQVVSIYSAKKPITKKEEPYTSILIEEI